MPKAVESDEAFYPTQIGSFGPRAIVANPQAMAKLRKEPGTPGRRVSRPTLHPPNLGVDTTRPRTRLMRPTAEFVVRCPDSSDPHQTSSYRTAAQEGFPNPGSPMLPTAVAVGEHYTGHLAPRHDPTPR